MAEHKKLQHLCAIKCISKTDRNGNSFLKETEFLKNLKSIYVPVLYDYEEDTQYWYLIEEYIAGNSLKNLKENQEFISQERLMTLAIKLCEAMQWLHERKPYPLLYLDLKPEHIIITEGGIKLLDFGAALYLKGKQMTGIVMGTKGFAAPEQMEGSGIDVRSDIYSIGAVFYWLMTGKVVGDEGILERVRGYSKDWTTVVEKCVWQDKKRRYRSVKELLEDIQGVQKKQAKRQLDKSLRIAVIGSQQRAGVTHFCIGLCISCMKNHRNCLYEEKNDSGAVQDIFRYFPKSREKEGVYYFAGLKVLPRYGSAIQIESTGEQISVLDYGVFQEELIAEYEEADCIIVVAGGKEWELRQTRELVERYRKRENIYYVLHGSKKYFRKIQRELGLSEAFCMPCYENVFLIRKKERQFYENLLMRIMTNMTRSRNDSEKKWKVYHCYRHNWNR